VTEKRRRAAGEGTIYHDAKRGHYVGAITIDGKRRKVVGKTKTETRTRLRALIAAKEIGATVTDGRMTVADVVTRFLDRDVANRRRDGKPLAPSTLEVYRWTGNLVIAELGKVKAKDATPGDVERMLDRLAAREVKPLGVESLRRVLFTVDAAFRFAQRRGDVVRNPAEHAVAPQPTKAREERTVLDADQARRLLAVLDDEPNGAMFVLSLRLGLRPGEAAGLYWTDLDLDDRPAVHVRRGLRVVNGRSSVVDEVKTAASRRTIDLPPEVAELLQRHRRDQLEQRLAAPSWIDDRLAFASPTGNVLSPPNVRRQLADICQRAEVPVVRPNELRHAAASILSDLGVPHQQIADLLGHTTSRMVDRTYRHRLSTSIDVASVNDWTKSARDA